MVRDWYHMTNSNPLRSSPFVRSTFHAAAAGAALRVSSMLCYPVASICGLSCFNLLPSQPVAITL
jgi:hypothetical protein